jgi:hypothetical protein
MTITSGLVFGEIAPLKQDFSRADVLIFLSRLKTLEDSTTKRITINALVDIGCLITFIPSLVSGLVLYLVFPEGGGRGSGWILFLGTAKNQWITLHNYTSMVFATLLIIHLILHWMFFRNIRRCFNPRGKQECVSSE